MNNINQKNNDKKLKLRKFFQKKAKNDMGIQNLYNRFQVFWECKSSVLLDYMNVDSYTDHGQQHTLRTEEKIFSLLTSKSKKHLSSIELFCLLYSSCLHDIGMMKKNYLSEKIEDIRKDHPDRVKLLLEQNPAEYQLNKHEAKVIGNICQGHGLSDLSELELQTWPLPPYGDVNIIFLTALLRLGDLLDQNYMRAPSVIVGLKMITGESLKHWLLHDKITDIQVDHKMKEINIYANANNEHDLCELYKLRNYIQNELDCIKDILEEKFIFINTVRLETQFNKKLVLSQLNPFIKLESFGLKLHTTFFGRDNEIRELYDKIISNEITVLVGESGVGKTSLLNAGIKLKIIEKEYYTFTVRATENLIESFSKNIKQLFKQYSNNNIYELLENISRDKNNIILFFDQFEEIFTCNDLRLKKEILSFYKKIIKNENINIKSVISIREDFLADLWDVSNSIPEFYDRKRTYRLKKLNRDNARQIIVKTIEHLNYSIEDELVDKLLNHFTQKEETIYPPYIQIVCHKIYEQHKLKYKGDSKKTKINYEDYCVLGKAEKIIADYFESILKGFMHEERVVINEILKNMITFFQTKQRISYDKIIKINQDRISIDKTLEKLIKHRIIRKIESEKHNEYELIHDFLARKILNSPFNISISPKVKLAKVYIEKNISQPITLEDVANHIGYSREHFCRVFKIETNQNFIEYINNERIEKAKKILQNDPHMKIVDIYSEIGFSSAQNFTRTFGAITGLTPTEYKSQHKDSRIVDTSLIY